MDKIILSELEKERLRGRAEAVGMINAVIAICPTSEIKEDWAKIIKLLPRLLGVGVKGESRVGNTIAPMLSVFPDLFLESNKKITTKEFFDESVH
ncbi:MAG: hypothetical protein PHI85_09255 [Victivallaceae bacterium]|nr:hypothetical protein [Victivallaceae bacterium]